MRYCRFFLNAPRNVMSIQGGDQSASVSCLEFVDNRVTTTDSETRGLVNIQQACTFEGCLFLGNVFDFLVGGGSGCKLTLLRCVLDQSDLDEQSAATDGVLLRTESCTIRPSGPSFLDPDECPPDLASSESPFPEPLTPTSVDEDSTATHAISPFVSGNQDSPSADATSPSPIDDLSTVHTTYEDSLPASQAPKDESTETTMDGETTQTVLTFTPDLSESSGETVTATRSRTPDATHAPGNGPNSNDDASTIVWASVGAGVGVIAVVGVAVLLIRVIIKKKPPEEEHSPEPVPAILELDGTVVGGEYLNPVAESADPEFFIVTEAFATAQE
jgi:hypothetical protein